MQWMDGGYDALMKAYSLAAEAIPATFVLTGTDSPTVFLCTCAFLAPVYVAAASHQQQRCVGAFCMIQLYPCDCHVIAFLQRLLACACNSTEYRCAQS